MKSLLLILILMGLSDCILTREEDECPDPDVIYPCDCSHYGTESFIRCTGSTHDTSLKALQKILSNVAHSPAIDLRLSGYNLGRVPSKLFAGLDVWKLVLSEMKIHSFESEDGSPVFSGLEDKLKELYIYRSIREPHIYNFTWKLNHLHKLQRLEFTGNYDKQLHKPSQRPWKLNNDWFENGPSSLKVVKLSYNDIESLGDRAFADLVNLRELKANKNKIVVIQRSMFPDPADKLISIDFSNNEIETLPKDIFSNMPSLETVKLSDNQLETLDQRVWSTVWEQLELLTFGDYLICDSTINWVFTMKRPSDIYARCSEHSGDPDKRGKHLENLIDQGV